MLLHRADDAGLRRRARRRKRVARTFALACRLLPRDAARRRLPACTSSSARSTTSSTRATRTPRRGSRRSRRGARASPPRSREARLLAGLARRHPLPRDAIARLLRGHARRPARRARSTTEAELDVYCYRVAGTVGVVMAARPRRDRSRARRATPRRSARRCSARTSCATSTRTSATAASTSRARRSSAVRRRAAAAGAARGAAARPDRARRRALRRRLRRASRCCRCGRRAIAAAGAMYREILRQIERDGYGARPGRAVVSRQRKLLVAARAPVPARCAHDARLFRGAASARSSSRSSPTARSRGCARRPATKAIVGLLLGASAPTRSRRAGARARRRARRQRGGARASRPSSPASRPAGRSGTTRTRRCSGARSAACRCAPRRRGR